MVSLGRATAIVVVLSTACGATCAQAFDGRWNARFASNGSQDRQARVVIQGGTGTWTALVPGERDPRDTCIGRPLTVTFTPGPSSTVALVIHAQAVKGRPNRRARLTVVDEQTLEGEFEDGRVLRLVRDHVGG